MASKGIFVGWPDKTEISVEAHVARSQPDLQHRNTIALRVLKTYVYWASPMLLAPAENWYLHAAVVNGRDREFEPATEGSVGWEHFPIQADGLTAFQFRPDCTYVFYLTAKQASNEDLKAHEMPWQVFIYASAEKFEHLRILFPAQPLDSDRHGDDYSEEFDLSRPIGTLVAFNSDEHLELADDAQRLVDFYALNGLIDGGVLIRHADEPIEKWDILAPDPKGDPSLPYGNVPAFQSYHWHYVVPSSTFSLKQAKASPAHASASLDDQTPQNAATLWAAGPTWTAADLKAAIGKGEAAALSLGQILMLAGDFFESLDEMKIAGARVSSNIMKGIDHRKRFACMIVDVASLKHTGVLSDDKAQLDFMEDVSKGEKEAETKISWDKVAAIANGLRKIRGPTKYSELHTLAQMIVNRNGQKLTEVERLLPWARSGVRTDLAKILSKEEVAKFDSTGFNDEIFNIGVSNGHYADLALENVPHFCPSNWEHFENYQQQALLLVEQQMKGASPRHPIPADAIANTVFGLHFLTDSFSAGHMRVPRAALGAEGALAAKLMHDMDGHYGLQVTNGFGEGWRAFGDGNLRKTTLSAEQTRILTAIASKGAKKVSADADTNWEKAKAAVGAAFKQLHYHAQGFFEAPKDQADDDKVALKDVQKILAANRGKTSLMGDENSKGKAAKETSLAEAVAVNISGRLEYMRNYQPKPNPEGTDVLQNHPPLFLPKGELNTAGSAYSVDKPSFGMKRVLCLKWHGVKDKSIKVDFSKYYYLAKFTTGASAEGWVKTDETKLVGVLDGLPKA